MTRRPDRGFFERPVIDVAPDLLGCIVEHEGVAVRLTEVEAYDGANDPASHAFRGPTARNAVMFGPPGYVYVYFTYGMHWCMNLVCGPVGQASAVLVRAGEVVSGLDKARARRPSARSPRDLARGPARLTMSLGIDGLYDGADLFADGAPFCLQLRDPVDGTRIRRGPRVGVGGAAAAWPWRFWIADEPTVSVYRPHTPRGRRARPALARGGSE